MRNSGGYKRLLLSFFSAYLIPPRCPACDATVPIFGKAEPFCEICRAEWDAQTAESCPVCGLSPELCVCLPDALREKGIRDAIFLSFYRAGQRSVSDRMLYRIKSERDMRVFRFLAGALTERIIAFCTENGIDPQDAALTALPRRRRAVREHGFDQAVTLARAIAKASEIPYLTLLKRSRGGKEQKRLSGEERIENLRNAFSLAVKGACLTGKTVFLVDDIMTTGSGLSACAALLLDAGADRVIPVTVARTVKNRAEVKGTEKENYEGNEGTG